MDRVLLINSFGFFPTFPSVSTAKVAALLKNEDLTLKNYDLNLAFWNEMLKPDFLSLCQFREWAMKETHVPFPINTNAKTHSIHKENVINNISKAMNVFKSQNDFYNHKKLSWAVNILFQAQQLIFFHYGCFITNKVIFWPKIGLNVNNIEIIYNLSIDNEHNPFILLFSKILQPLIEKYCPNVIGVEIAFPWEILPALTVNKLIKKYFPEIHLNFTGHGFDEMSFARVAHRLRDNPKLFFDFDSVFLVRNDYDLIKFYLKGPRLVDSVVDYNSLALKIDNKIEVSDNILERYNEQNLFPDYSDLNLNEYYTPHLVLVDKISNKCFWSKCAFCNINSFKKDNYKVTPTIFYNRLLKYHRKYNSKHFFILDEAIDADYISTLCDIFLENSNQFIWSIRTRIDAGFSNLLLMKMYKAGCREMWIGMENASPNLLRAMNKCDDPEDYVNQIERIVKECNLIGIGLHFCLLFGFPSETDIDRLINYKFFKKIRKHINKMPFFITFNIFNLNYGSSVYKYPDKYKIDWIDCSETNFNMINIAYKTTNGNDLTNKNYEKNIDTLANYLLNIFVPSKTNQLLWFVMGDSPWELLYKEHYAKIGKNPYQNGGGIFESVIVYLYILLEKHPLALSLFNYLSNKKYIETKAQIYR